MSTTPNLPGALRAMHAGLVDLHDGKKSLTLTADQLGLLLAAADELERKLPPTFYRITPSSPKLIHELEWQLVREALRTNQPSVLVVGQDLTLEIIQPTNPDLARMVEAIGQALAHRECLPDAVATELENALKGNS